MNTNDRPTSGDQPTPRLRLSGFNYGFLLVTSAALIAWVIFLLVVALAY